MNFFYELNDDVKLPKKYACKYFLCRITEIHKMFCTENIAESLKKSFVQRGDKLRDASDIKRMTDGFPVLDQRDVPSGKSTE